MVGLKWFKSCFHLHTPASADYKGDKSISAKEFLVKIIESGLDVIGISDHHSFEWISDLRVARDELVKEGMKKIIIFPGTEIHTNDSVHILVFFEPETEYSELTHFLSELGIREENFGDEKYQSEYTLEPGENCIFTKIKKYKAMTIFAHVKLDGKGLLKACKGHGIKAKIIESKKFIFESRDTLIDEVKIECPGVAIIKKTDFHDIEDLLGNKHKFTWIKLQENPDLLSLSQLIYDPEMRISYEDSIQTEGIFIDKLHLTSNYFIEPVINFHPELNTIIGGRGSGKSLIIEGICYILGYYPENDFYVFENFTSKLNELLDDGNELRLEFINGSSRFRISREFHSFPSKMRKEKYLEIIDQYKQDYTPTLEEFIEDSWIEQPSHNIRKLIPIHIYLQSSVIDIAKAGENALKLIDSFADLSSDDVKFYGNLNSKNEIIEEIEKLEIKIIDLYDQVREPREIDEELKQINVVIAELNEKLLTPEYKSALLWDQQEQAFSRLKKELKKYKTKKYPKLPKLNIIDGMSDGSINKVKESYKNLEKSWKNANESINNLKNKNKELLGLLNKEWKDSYKKQKSDFRNLGFDIASEESKLKNTLKVKNKEKLQVEHIKEKNNEIILELKALEDVRKGKMVKLNEIDSSILNFREKICGLVQGRIGRPDIKIEIKRSYFNDFLFNFLDKEVLTKVRNKSNTINKVLQSFNKEELLSLLTNEDITSELDDKLKNLGLTETATRKIRKYSRSEETLTDLSMITDKSLLELERTIYNIEIILNYRKEEKWKKLKQLSPGEKCSLLLKVLLAKANNILIIDQPEDELDYNTRSSIVELIKERKINRQLIFVTHFQNIPVLADSENIIKMEEKDNKSYITSQGCFEEMINNIIEMEGGKEAFDLRHRKYQQNFAF